MKKQVIEEQKSVRSKCAHNKKNLAEMVCWILTISRPKSVEISTDKSIGSYSVHPQHHLIPPLE